MSVIFILIPLSIVIAAGFLFAFVWAVKSGQYEDVCTPSMRVLIEETGAAGVPSSDQTRRAGIAPAGFPSASLGERKGRRDAAPTCSRAGYAATPSPRRSAAAPTLSNQNPSPHS